MVDQSPLAKSFRLPRFREYVEVASEIPKASNFAILILTFNNIQSLKRVCEYVLIHNLDVVVIDNHSTDGTYGSLSTSYGSRINTIRLRENLGGAGGFAVGQEWVIERNYEFCIISEDDAIPIDRDIIPKLMIHAGKERIVQTKHYGLKNQLFAFHFALYPVAIFKVAGVVNANLFFRGDDYEYGMRLQRVVTDLNIKPFCLNKYYKHPYLKFGYGIGATYFTVRNQLVIFAVQGKYLDMERLLLKYLCYGFHALLQDMNSDVIKLVSRGVLDYFLCRFSRNIVVSKAFGNSRLWPQIEPSIQEHPWEQFASKFQKYKSWTTVTALITDGLIHKKIWGSLENVIVSKYSQPSRMAAFSAKRAVFIEEIDLHNRTLKYFEFKNPNRFISVVKLLLSCFLGLISWAIIAPMAILRGHWYRKLSKGLYLKGNPYTLFHRDTDKGL